MNSNTQLCISTYWAIRGLCWSGHCVAICTLVKKSQSKSASAENQDKPREVWDEINTLVD